MIDLGKVSVETKCIKEPPMVELASGQPLCNP